MKTRMINGFRVVIKGNEWKAIKNDPASGRRDVFKGYGPKSLRQFEQRAIKKGDPKPWSHGVTITGKPEYFRNRFFVRTFDTRLNKKLGRTAIKGSR